MKHFTRSTPARAAGLLVCVGLGLASAFAIEVRAIPAASHAFATTASGGAVVPAGGSKGVKVKAQKGPKQPSRWSPLRQPNPRSQGLHPRDAARGSAGGQSVGGNAPWPGAWCAGERRRAAARAGAPWEPRGHVGDARRRRSVRGHACRRRACRGRHAERTFELAGGGFAGLSAERRRRSQGGTPGSAGHA
jgi:hypothetical protein